MPNEFPRLPHLHYWKTKSNDFGPFTLEDGSTWGTTTQIESAAIGLDKACTLSNGDLNADVTLTDADLTSGIAVGTYPYILQTNSGGLETPVSGAGLITIHAEP